SPFFFFFHFHARFSVNRIKPKIRTDYLLRCHSIIFFAAINELPQIAPEATVVAASSPPHLARIISSLTAFSLI
ncbi:unnamed protein product, partial [Arabidopsis halleri]